MKSVLISSCTTARSRSAPAPPWRQGPCFGLAVELHHWAPLRAEHPSCVYGSGRRQPTNLRGARRVRPRHEVTGGPMQRNWLLRSPARRPCSPRSVRARGRSGGHETRRAGTADGQLACGMSTMYETPFPQSRAALLLRHRGELGESTGRRAHRLRAAAPSLTTYFPAIADGEPRRRLSSAATAAWTIGATLPDGLSTSCLRSRHPDPGGEPARWCRPTSTSVGFSEEGEEDDHRRLPGRAFGSRPTPTHAGRA